MPPESTIPIASHDTPRRFATRLALFYGTMFGMVGTHLPFFTVGQNGDALHHSALCDRSRRKTPRAPRRYRGNGLCDGARVFHSRHPASAGAGISRLRGHLLPVDADGAADRCLCLARRGAPWPQLWTVAAGGLGGVRGRRAGMRAAGRCHRRPKPDLGHRIGGNAWRLRRPWPSAAGHAKIACEYTPWGRRLAARPRFSRHHRDVGPHSRQPAYYIFASIAWQQAGLGGLTIAGLWSLGVIAEIVVFALSPRFTLPPVMLVVIAALSAVARWVITAQEPPLAILAAVQLAHGLTFGLTQVGTMMLLVGYVPGHVMARGQGYLAACSGIVSSSTSILSGAVYAQYGQGVYYVMAAMALSGAVVMWLARHRLAHHPQSAASGG